MPTAPDQDIAKEPMKDQLYGGGKSALRKYQDFFVGHYGWSRLVRYEICAMLIIPLPGALGLLLRKIFIPSLLQACGGQSLWGRDVQLRHPGNIRVGERVAVDDHCLLDARGAGGISIGDDAVIARGCVFLAKTGEIVLGERCVVANQSQLSSTSGIRIGNDVGIGGQCYIGGGLYRTDRRDIPMLQQGLYSRGPVVIGDDVWIGAGVRILDGVNIGRGSFIGAGTVVSDNIPAYSMVIPYQKSVVLPRGGSAEGSALISSQGSVPIDQTLRRRVKGCIAAAIDEVNRQLPSQERLAADETTVLFDSASGDGLDSLGLINFIVISEQKLEEEFGRTVSLSFGTEGADGTTSFACLAKLVDSITTRVQQGF
jgi:acetyltransferase-like isoleucine patch superfamily enzyme